MEKYAGYLHKEDSVNKEKIRSLKLVTVAQKGIIVRLKSDSSSLNAIAVSYKTELNIVKKDLEDEIEDHRKDNRNAKIKLILVVVGTIALDVIIVLLII